MTRPDDVQALGFGAFLRSPLSQLVVDEQGRLAVFNHCAGTLLALSEDDIGRPFGEIEVSGWQAKLLAEMSAVQENRTAVWLREVEWQRTASERLFLDIEVVPLVDEADRLRGIVVNFVDVSRLRQFQDDLESANRQLGTAYDELQSTTEELESTNEQLHSTIEELETSNEGLQNRGQRNGREDPPRSRG